MKILYSRAFNILIITLFISIFFTEFSFAQLYIVTPEGKPQILSVSFQTFNSGEEGTIKVTVKNVADETGSFYANLDGSCPIASQRYISTAINVKSGEIKEINIPIVGGQGQATCTVTVIDKNSAESNSFPVQITILKPAECLPDGSYEVVGRTIYRCEDGKSIKVESCATGVIYENNVPKCVKLTSEVGEGFQQEMPSLSSLNYSRLITWIVIGVVGIVLGSGASYFIFKYRKTKKK